MQDISPSPEDGQNIKNQLSQAAQKFRAKAVDYLNGPTSVKMVTLGSQTALFINTIAATVSLQDGHFEKFIANLTFMGLNAGFMLGLNKPAEVESESNG